MEVHVVKVFVKEMYWTMKMDVAIKFVCTY